MFEVSILESILILVLSFFISIITYSTLKKKKHVDLNSMNISSSKNVVTSLGLSFVISFLLLTLYFFLEYNLLEIFPNRYYIFFLALIVLTIISFIDDVHEIDAKLRLIVQVVLIYFSTTSLELYNINIPLKLVIFFSVFFWVYILNITNFIDGSDGHCLSHTISFFLGILLISNYYDFAAFPYYLAYINIYFLISFAYFNIPKAKAYMGDSGSIYLGFIIGYIFLDYSIKGMGLLMLSLYIYPLMDCTVTLMKKVSRGYYPWAKMADYFFLIPINAKQKHGKVFFSSLIYNLLNLGFIYLQMSISKWFFILSFLSSIILITYYCSFKNEK